SGDEGWSRQKPPWLVLVLVLDGEPKDAPPWRKLLLPPRFAADQARSETEKGLPSGSLPSQRTSPPPAISLVIFAPRPTSSWRAAAMSLAQKPILGGRRPTSEVPLCRAMTQPLASNSFQPFSSLASLSP